VRWRSILGAQLGGVGVNAIVPARGGDAVRLFLAHRCVEGSTYTTLTSTLVLLTAFDFVVASVFALWALTLGVLPGASILRRFSAFDFVWLVRHPREALILFALFFIALLLLLAWFAERIDDFKRRITQGFAILRDKQEYVRRVALWQTADWLLRLTAIFWFLRAFGLPATIHNALLVQVSQSLATLLPISPSGIGTEQAFLLYLFRGKVARTTLLSFSVGMRITVMIVNAMVGFIAIFLMLRTFRWRERLEEAPAPEQSA
jgi:uncharacterized membrane protein YbhN (UPF0104 family)